ncbi:MAG: hypothetical protein LBE25_03280 [Arthrobacter sp.]|jgi:hypothetical protein|nr:hypothetical protein [Arthrobacter sp.]
MPSSAVWRLAIFLSVLSIIATVLNVLLGAPLGAQALGLAGAFVATFGAACYTVGTGFPGARGEGLRGGLSGLLASGFALSLITGFWSAVQQRLSPAAWDVGAAVSLLLYIVAFLMACTLAFWCITELVLRDRQRTAAAARPGADTDADAAEPTQSQPHR